MSSGGLGVCQPAQDQFHRIEWLHYLGEGGVIIRLRITFLLLFFSFSAFLLFSYPDYENVPFHPVKTILDNYIKILGSHHITHANFVKKCDQFCLIALRTEKRKTIITILWEIVYRSGFWSRKV